MSPMEALTRGLSDREKDVIARLRDQCSWWIVRHIQVIMSGIDIQAALAVAENDVEAPDIVIGLTAHVVRHQQHVSVEGSVSVDLEDLEP